MKSNHRQSSKLDKNPIGVYYLGIKEQVLQTVVETPEFIKQVRQCMDNVSLNEFINYIAANLLAGEIVVGTGGARKIRWNANSHQGKSGGVRVIYYYHSEIMPIFLFTVYGKNQRANITEAERSALKSIIKQIIRLYEEENHE